MIPEQLTQLCDKIEALYNNPSSYERLKNELVRSAKPLIDAARESVKLYKENKVLSIKAAGSLANNLCPDHRDKQTFQPCLACQIEKLRAELDKVRKERNAAYERAAQVCENVEEKPWYGYENPNSFYDGVHKCAAAIRALKEKP